jgi:3-methylcrotonyl-CoA carboxylase alpha subunit
MVEAGGTLHLFIEGRHAVIAQLVTDDALQATDGAEEGSLLTPLPGTVVAVHVKPGQAVERGAALITVEAMKMEHTLTAPYAGVVSRIPFGVSDRVAGGAVLVELQAT